MYLPSSGELVCGGDPPDPWPVRRCPGLVFPIHILGEEGESLRVERREVVVGDLSVVCMGFINLCLQAGR